MERGKRLLAKHRIFLLAAAVGLAVCLWLIWREFRPAPAAVFRWEDQYFAPTVSRPLTARDNGHGPYYGLEGRFLGEIQSSSKGPLPQQNRESVNIAPGTKVYTVDVEKARGQGREDTWNVCGLLLVTESGGVYFAYPYAAEESGTESPQTVGSISRRVYETFYPDYPQLLES